MEGGHGGELRVRSWAGIAPECDREDGPVSGGLLSIGPVAVLIFVGEAILAKSQIPGVRISFIAHMTATAALLGALAWLGLQTPSDHERDAAIDEKLSWIRLCVKLLVLWGFASCFAQEMVLGNLAFWLLWSANLYVAFWSMPRLLANLDETQRVRLLSGVFLVCIVASLLVEPLLGSSPDRLSGVFGSPTLAARVFAIASVLWVSRWLTEVEPPRWLVPTTFVTTVLLVMTRTRASIAAGIVGCAVVVVLATTRGPRKSSMGLTKTFLLLDGLAIALLVVLLSGYFPEDRIAAFFRLEGGVAQVYSARSMNWQRGFSDLLSYGVFGRGFLSKFANWYGTTTILGVTVPKYDWTTAADPLNMVVLLSQQIGIPGGLLLVGLVLAVFRASRALVDRMRFILVGLLATGLIYGLFDGNWLTSFGDPVDRISLFAIAALLTAETLPAGLDNNGSSSVLSGDQR